jgi:hypothetical protein
MTVTRGSRTRNEFEVAAISGCASGAQLVFGKVVLAVNIQDNNIMKSRHVNVALRMKKNKTGGAAKRQFIFALRDRFLA